MFSPSKDRQNGGIMIYILVAVALLSALTVSLSRQSSQTGQYDLSDERIAFQVNEILQLSSVARGSIDAMLMAGSHIDDLVFIPPDDPEFGNHTIHNIYHPHGGGLSYASRVSTEACVMNDSESDACRIYIDRHLDFEGTASDAEDVLLYVHHLKEGVCQAINRKITGSTEIPTATVILRSLFIEGGDVTEANCAGCMDVPALCIEGLGGVYGYYSMLASQ